MKCKYCSKTLEVLYKDHIGWFKCQCRNCKAELSLSEVEVNYEKTKELKKWESNCY